MTGKTKANFFIVGAAKSGTTSLAEYLNQHPQIFMSSIKEPKYFSFPDNIFPHSGPGAEHADRQVVKTIYEYESMFAEAEKYPIRGEASVDYLYFPNVPQRIKEYNKNAKVLIILRNPVGRAYSAYMHYARDGLEKLKFEDALEAEAIRKKDNYEFFWLYQELGFYYEQVKRYLDCFGRENVHIEIFDEFKQDPKAVVEGVCSFLDLGKIIPNTNRVLNESGIPSSRRVYSLFNENNLFKTVVRAILPKELRKNILYRVNKRNLVKHGIGNETEDRLRLMYRADILKLQDLIGKDLSSWLK